MYDNPPAFPMFDKDDTVFENPVRQPGMSLRDYFAAHAPEMPREHLDNYNHVQHARYDRDKTYPLRSYIEILAEWRGKYADEMLRERSKRNASPKHDLSQKQTQGHTC